MSASDAAPLTVGCCELDAAEIIARPGRREALQSHHAGRLPALQHAAVLGALLGVSVRPDRWLLLGAPGAPALAAALAPSAADAVVLERGAGLRGLWVAGPAHRELLARGCRLDLGGDELAPNRAGATLIAQTPVTLLALAHGMLLLAPASLAQHLHEWLLLSARALAPLTERDVPFQQLTGESSR